MDIHQPLKGQLTCPTCSSHFETSQQHKLHYKSDHHRYNIKRKMVKLAPVSLEQFNSKMQEIKNQNDVQFVCKQCRKTFGSANTLNQHVQSKGHNPNAIIEPKVKVPKAPQVFEKNHCKCLLCGVVNASLDENQQHMQKDHSFFIAEKKYCINIKGLIEYLQEKIEVGNICLTCDNKGTKDFQSADAVRQHMIDRGHHFMDTNKGFEEYEKFYDFSELFDEKLKDQKNIVPGIDFEKVRVFVDESETKMIGEDEEDWEDEEGDEEEGDSEEWQDEGDDQIAEVEEEEKQIQQVKQGGKKHRIKTYQIMKPTMTSNDELLLPNGRVLGHRKYRHLYHQNVRLPNWFTNSLKMLTNGGQPGSALTAIAERRNRLEQVKEERLNNSSTMRLKRDFLRVGMSNNIQLHYRCQNSL